jgi:hypothetical protein
LPVSTLNAAAATEPEIDINGAKYKSDKKEQQIQVFFNQEFFKIFTYQTLFSLGKRESELGEPEVLPGLTGYYFATVIAGRFVLKIIGKDKYWIKATDSRNCLLLKLNILGYRKLGFSWPFCKFCKR